MPPTKTLDLQYDIKPKRCECLPYPSASDDGNCSRCGRPIDRQALLRQHRYLRHRFGLSKGQAKALALAMREKDSKRRKGRRS